MWDFFKASTVKNKDLSRDQLIQLTMQHFQSLFDTTEVENLVSASRYLLQQLSPADTNFDKDYDAIIVGTLINACAIEKWKYKMSTPEYSQTWDSLIKKCGISKLPLYGLIYKNPNWHQLIMTTGNNALNKTLPFEVDFVIAFKEFEFAKHLPIMERLAAYFPDDAEKIFKPEESSNCVVM